jgi:hypothetical protein
MKTLMLVILATLLLGCATHNYKITQSISGMDWVAHQITTLTYHCAYTCFKEKSAFSTDTITIDFHTNEITCYCKKRTTDYSGDFE